MSFFFSQNGKNAYRKRNNSAKVKINRVPLTKETGIKVRIVQSFQSLLMEPSGEWSPSIRDMCFDVLHS